MSTKYKSLKGQNYEQDGNLGLWAKTHQLQFLKKLILQNFHIYKTPQAHIHSQHL